jgi:hypothetical protein
MTSTAWQAFYFHGLDNAHPPARTELIEAATEDDAAKVAISHMGDCKRVDLSAPRWEPQQDRVILAEGGRCEIDAVSAEIASIAKPGKIGRTRKPIEQPS